MTGNIKSMELKTDEMVSLQALYLEINVKFALRYYRENAVFMQCMIFESVY